MRWTRTTLAARIRETWDTLRRVPEVNVPGHVSHWPSYVRDAMEAYGYGEVIVRLPPASPQAIDRMDEVFTWFIALEGKPHLTIAMWLTCGIGIGPKRAGDIIGVHRDTVRVRRDEALDTIVHALNHRMSKAA